MPPSGPNAPWHERHRLVYAANTDPSSLKANGTIHGAPEPRRNSVAGSSNPRRSIFSCVYASTPTMSCACSPTRLDFSLTPPTDPALVAKRVDGELWTVHGGGFYHPQKYLVAPKTLLEHLHWFYWERYWTWMSGFGLLLCAQHLLHAAGADQALVRGRRARSIDGQSQSGSDPSGSFDAARCGPAGAVQTAHSRADAIIMSTIASNGLNVEWTQIANVRPTY